MTHGSTPQWRKSSHSSHEGGECVEVAAMADKIAVRDSKNPSGDIHVLTPTAFQVLTQRIRAGLHDQ